MIKIIILGLGVLIYINLSAQTTIKKDLKHVPQNLDEAIQQLDLIYHDTIKNAIYNMSEDEFLANSHFSTDMWIRNNWGLWKGKKLSKYFNKLEIYHPDDMSSIILRCYHRHLHGKPCELEKQIEFYHDYWEKAKEHEYKMRTDSIYVQQKKIEDEKARIEYYNKIKEPYPSGSKVTAWVDCSIGLFSSGRTKIEGLIVGWDDIYAIVDITKYLDEKKKNKVKRFNKMADNKIRVNIYQLEIWE
jgi:hypothetical protein